MTNSNKDQIKESVRESYAAAARGFAVNLAVDGGQSDESGGDCSGTSGCCGPTQSLAPGFGSGLYENLAEADLPDGATQSSLGCGNPTAVAELNFGETVLDLGSGAGLDVMLSANRVGPTGKAYGLDMTDEMLELARRNQAEAGVENVEFLKGDIEDVPLPDGSVDVIISNCVINLSADKGRVFTEAARVLAPGGRFAVTDVLATRALSDSEKSDMAQWSGCIAGALTQEEFVAGLSAAGFVDIDVKVTHDVAEIAVSAIVRAVRA